LRMIAKLSSKPVILRTQKRLEAGDFRSIAEAGLKGMSIDPSTLEPGVEAYRDAITTFRSRVTTSVQTNR
jgi:hypothetical protein